jgi:cell wall-associated NlpC family hydrolase
MAKLLKQGICGFCIVPVRTEPSDKSELCTQLLFGDTYLVTGISENQKWLQIKLAFDDYEGWIDAKLHTGISKEVYSKLQRTKPYYSKEMYSCLHSEEFTMPLAAGSVLPFYQDETVTLDGQQLIFVGKHHQPVESGSFEQIKELACTYLKAPYLWGGKTHFGIDCSGFVQQVYKMSGYKLKRDAWQQAEQGALVESVNDALPGDLAFFINPSGRVIHVGIILEENRIIHAHGEVRIDVLDKKGIFNTSKKLYSHKLSIIRRVI